MKELVKAGRQCVRNSYRLEKCGIVLDGNHNEMQNSCPSRIAIWQLRFIEGPGRWGGGKAYSKTFTYMSLYW